MITYTVTMPGAFDSWFSGSSVAQGQTGGEACMESLHAAYRVAVPRRIGRRGYTLTLRLDADALDCLQDYAETSAEIHGGDFGKSCPDYRAAVDMLARIEAAREAAAA